MAFDLFYQKQTEKNFEQALSDLITSVKKHGFSVLSVIDMQKKYQELGKTSEPISVVQLCNAEFAYHAISISKKMICMMPKDISIYVDDNGKVTLIFMRANPNQLEQAFPGAGLPEMSAKIGGILQQIVNDAV
jgi:uncharacterized protein (DUF302 family)